MPSPSAASLEETRPKLVPGTEFIPFSEHVTFLKNTTLGAFLKLTSAEAVRAREFDGTRTFSDILHKHISTAAGNKLLNVAELLLYLKTRGFIAPESSEGENAADGAVKKSDEVESPAKPKGIVIRDLYRLPWKFSNKILQKIAGFAGSTMGLLILAFIPVICLLISPAYLFFDLKNVLLGAISLQVVLFLYCKVFAWLLLFVAVIFSVKKIVNAYSPAEKGYAAAISGLLFIALLPIIIIVLSSDYQSFFSDFVTSTPAGVSTQTALLHYCIFIALLWLFSSIIVSTKNILSAYLLAGNGLQTIRPRMVMVWGFIYFDCTITDIVSLGPFATVRLYIMRLLVPILMLHGAAALGLFFPGDFVLAIFKKTCIIITAFSLMPLIKTDLNNLLFLVSSSTRDFKQSLVFLGKKYFSRVENFSIKPGSGNDFSYIISLLTIIWLVIILGMLWKSFIASYFYFAEVFRNGFSLENAYIPLQTIAMLVPFIVLVAMAFFVGASNVQHALRSPLYRLRMLSEKMKKADKPQPEMVDTFVKQLPLFSTLTAEQRTSLCKEFDMVSCKTGREVVLQGEPGDSFYIIVSGRMRVVIEDVYGVERTVAILSVGDCFGEIALLENIPRTATVIATASASLLKLEKRQFDRFLAALPIERNRITDQIRHGKLLMSIPLFSYLSPEQFSFLITRSSVELFAKGEVIFRQGDYGDKMYIIKDGQVGIRREENGQAVLEKTLSTGSVFGEIALVKQVTRTAQATAESDVYLLSVERESFYELINKSILTGAEVDRLADRRIAEIGSLAARKL
jgi:CRP-like cAMP-binding protein